MAYVGIANPIIACYHEDNGKVSYSEGVRLGRAIKCEIEPNYEDVSEYSGINDTDEEQEFSYADITLVTNELPESADKLLFGHQVDGSRIVSGYTDKANWIGLGLRVRKTVSGQKKFVAIWIHKVKFTEDSETHETRDNSIKYETPSIKGKAVPDVEGNWRTKRTFQTGEEADNWLNSMAGI